MLAIQSQYDRCYISTYHTVTWQQTDIRHHKHLVCRNVVRAGGYTIII